VTLKLLQPFPPDRLKTSLYLHDGAFAAKFVWHRRTGLTTTTTTTTNTTTTDLETVADECQLFV